MLLLASSPARSERDFTVEFSAESGGAWAAGKPRKAGGLGFEVGVASWPRLSQRGFLDIGSFGEGAQFLSKSSLVDLGEMRLEPDKALAKLEKATWCAAEFSAGTGAKTLRFWVSRLTPAFLCQTEAQMLDLFAGEKEVYASGADGAVTGRTKSQIVPAYAAFVDSGKVTVKPTDARLGLDRLSESWLLLWYGERAICRRLAVPNVIDDGYNPKYGQQLQKKWLIAADLPVLVVFQNKPLALEPADGALRVSFGAGGAAHVSLTPLWGFYRPPVTVTRVWKDALPADVVARCRAWAGRLKAYPASCSVAWQEKDGGMAMAVRERFTYLDLADAWSTPAERLAPVAPVVALCQRYGFPVSLVGKLAREPIATHSGPYTGIAGADAVEYTVRGMNRYVNEEVASPLPVSPEGKRLARELAEEIRKFSAAGLLAPGFSYAHPWQFFWYFTNPGDDLLALSEAMPYLDDATRKLALDYALSLLAKRHPFKTAKAAIFEGPRREYFRLLSPQYHKDIDPEIHFPTAVDITQEECANNLYGVWSLSRNSGQWDFLRELRDDAKRAAFSDKGLADWATCGFFNKWNRFPSWPIHHYQFSGGTDAVNGEMGRWIALARVARRFGDTGLADAALYWLNRTALNRFAQGKVVQYLYDEKIQTIEESPNWMIQWAWASGSSYLWTDHWAGFADDVRQVVQWDEYGPVPAFTQGEGVKPIMFAFLNLSPECGRFLGDFLSPECGRFVKRVERTAPAWFVVQGEPVLGREMNQDRPANPYNIFMAKCYVLGVEGSRMTRYQDIPAFRVGDAYHIRKLVANLRAFGGLKWQKVQR